MRGAARHRAARRFVAREARRSNLLGITPQVLAELVHVTTDPRRFERPLSMRGAVDLARRLWTAPEVARILPTSGSFVRACELLAQHRLGRKRILDTMLAAILEGASVARLATLNGADFRVFSFLEVVELD
jgi:predicted nucleic acid-binding protein